MMTHNFLGVLTEIWRCNSMQNTNYQEGSMPCQNYLWNIKNIINGESNLSWMLHNQELHFWFDSFEDTKCFSKIAFNVTALKVQEWGIRKLIYTSVHTTEAYFSAYITSAKRGRVIVSAIPHVQY